MLLTRLMLPMHRNGSPGCCLRKFICSAMLPLTNRVFLQTSGSASEFENTNLGRSLILMLTSSLAEAENSANA